MGNESLQQKVYELSVCHRSGGDLLVNFYCL
jgi:hypothetical protein